MTDYQAALKALVAGEQPTIEVPAEDFMAFRQAWLDFPKHQSIVGAAHRGGSVTYHYEQN
jgi:hypothetical protein